MPSRRELRYLITRLCSIGLRLACACLCVLTAGCRPKRYGVFTNATDRPVELRLEHKPTDRPVMARTSIIPSGESRRVRVYTCDRVVAQEPGGRQLFSHRGLLFEDRAGVYSREGEAKVHFLITMQGLFPIPVRLRKNWYYHIEGIRSANVNWVECPE